MRVLGIDPGLRRTGYACLELDRPGAVPRIVEAGVIRLRTPAPVADRLGELAADLRAVIDETRPGLLAVEQVFAHAKHVRTAILMAHARGVVLLAGAEAKLPLEELAPAEIKRAIAASGRADKEQIQDAVRVRFGLSVRPEPHDVADALAIGLCAAERAWTARLRETAAEAIVEPRTATGGLTATRRKPDPAG